METRLKLGNKEYDAFHEREDDPMRITYEWAIRNLDNQGRKNIENILEENLGKPVEENNNITLYGGSTNLLSQKKYNVDGIELNSRLIDLTKTDADSFLQNLRVNPILNYWGNPEEGKSHVLFSLSEKRQPEQMEPYVLEKSEIVKKY